MCTVLVFTGRLFTKYLKKKYTYQDDIPWVLDVTYFLLLTLTQGIQPSETETQTQNKNLWITQSVPLVRTLVGPNRQPTTVTAHNSQNRRSNHLIHNGIDVVAQFYINSQSTRKALNENSFVRSSLNLSCSDTDSRQTRQVVLLMGGVSISYPKIIKTQLKQCSYIK